VLFCPECSLVTCSRPFPVLAGTLAEDITDLAAPCLVRPDDDARVLSVHFDEVLWLDPPALAARHAKRGGVVSVDGDTALVKFEAAAEPVALPLSALAPVPSDRGPVFYATPRLLVLCTPERIEKLAERRVRAVALASSQLFAVTAHLATTGDTIPWKLQELALIRGRESSEDFESFNGAYLSCVPSSLVQLCDGALLLGLDTRGLAVPFPPLWMGKELLQLRWDLLPRIESLAALPLPTGPGSATQAKIVVLTAPDVLWPVLLAGDASAVRTLLEQHCCNPNLLKQYALQGNNIFHRLATRSLGSNWNRVRVHHYDRYRGEDEIYNFSNPLSSSSDNGSSENSSSRSSSSDGSDSEDSDPYGIRDGSIVSGLSDRLSDRRGSDSAAHSEHASGGSDGWSTVDDDEDDEDGSDRRSNTRNRNGSRHGDDGNDSSSESDSSSNHSTNSSSESHDGKPTAASSAELMLELIRVYSAAGHVDLLQQLFTEVRFL
jgi:hypothetical protein